MTHDGAGGSGPAGARLPLGERPSATIPGEDTCMAINITHRRDLDDRLERLAGPSFSPRAGEEGRRHVPRRALLVPVFGVPGAAFFDSVA